MRENAKHLCDRGTTAPAVNSETRAKPSCDAPCPSCPPLPLTGYLLLFAGMSLVGTYVALSKPLTTVFPVFLLAWLRFGWPRS
jgi:hypothetical protein